MEDINWQEIKAQHLEEMTNMNIKEFKRLFLCEFNPEGTKDFKWNDPRVYAPVEVEILINTPEGAVRVKRPPQYVNNVEDMVYLDNTGRRYQGGYPWRYT